jgi:ubiquitin-protein ligase
VTAPDWWLADPGGRQQKELDALAAAGIGWAIVAGGSAGSLFTLDVTVPGPDGDTAMRAVYPRLFPFFPPRVTATDLNLHHHWERRGGTVCLLKPGGAHWHPDETLADLLVRQWPKVLAANAGDGTDADGVLLETDQAEPWSAYIPTGPGAVAIVDSAAVPPVGVTHGTARWTIGRLPMMHATLLALDDDAGNHFFSAKVQQLLSPTAVQSPWVRITSPPDEYDAASLWRAAAAVHPQIDRIGWFPVERSVTGKAASFGRHVQLVLVRVPEEVGRRDPGEGWAVLVRTRRSKTARPDAPSAMKVNYAGRQDLHRRAPGLAAMSDKKVVVVGGGGLGSEVILGLAKALPGRLTVVDGDLMDAATAVRASGASRFANLTKVQALVQMAHDTQPYTELRSIWLKIGTADGDSDGSALYDQLMTALGEADLVIDCTADIGVQNFLASTLRAASRPYLQAEATKGVWAGLIALYPPAAAVCWDCVQRHLATPSLVAALPAEPGGGVATPGCLEPTYTGTGYDLAAIAAQVVRTAVSYLTAPAPHAGCVGSIVTVALRDDQGRDILPRWSSHDLAPHPDCASHDAP